MLIRKLIDYYLIMMMKAYGSWKNNRFTIDMYMGQDIEDIPDSVKIQHARLDPKLDAAELAKRQRNAANSNSEQGKKLKKLLDYWFRKALYGKEGKFLIWKNLTPNYMP